MKKSVSLSALVLLVGAAMPVDAQVSSTTRANLLSDLGQYFNSSVLGATRVSDRYDRDRDRYDRECREVWRNTSQRRLQLEQRLRQQHDNWHRTHNGRRDANWNRQHEALHQRLERERQVFERNEQRIRERALEQARRQSTQDRVWRDPRVDDRACNDDDDYRNSRNRRTDDDWHNRRDRDDDWDDRRDRDDDGWYGRNVDLKSKDKLDKELAKLDRKREQILEKERRRTDR